MYNRGKKSPYFLFWVKLGSVTLGDWAVYLVSKKWWMVSGSPSNAALINPAFADLGLLYHHKRFFGTLRYAYSQYQNVDFSFADCCDVPA